MEVMRTLAYWMLVGRMPDNLFVDFYSEVPDEGIRFISREYPDGKYKLQIKVTGTWPVWYNKAKTIRYGGHGYYVNVTKIVVLWERLNNLI